MGEMERLQQQRATLQGQQDALEAPWMPGDRLSNAERMRRAEATWKQIGTIDRRLDDLRVQQGLPTRLDEAFDSARQDAADGLLPSGYRDLPRRGTVVRENGSIGPPRPQHDPMQGGGKVFRRSRK